MGHARSVTDVYKHVPLRAHSTNSAAHAHHRVSTYSNVSVPVTGPGTNGTNRFGTSDTRASYNEQRRLGPTCSYPTRSIVYKSNSSLDLGADHVIWTGRQMTNLGSNFEYLLLLSLLTTTEF